MYLYLLDDKGNLENASNCVSGVTVHDNYVTRAVSNTAYGYDGKAVGGEATRVVGDLCLYYTVGFDGAVGENERVGSTRSGSSRDGGDHACTSVSSYTGTDTGDLGDRGLVGNKAI